MFSQYFSGALVGACKHIFSSSGFPAFEPSRKLLRRGELGVKNGPAVCLRVDTAGVLQLAVDCNSLALASFSSRQAGSEIGSASPILMNFRR